MLDDERNLIVGKDDAQAFVGIGYGCEQDAMTVVDEGSCRQCLSPDVVETRGVVGVSYEVVSGSNLRSASGQKDACT